VFLFVDCSVWWS